MIGRVCWLVRSLTRGSQRRDQHYSGIAGAGEICWGNVSGEYVLHLTRYTHNSIHQKNGRQIKCTMRTGRASVHTVTGL